jgi:hypothetical protein
MQGQPIYVPYGYCHCGCGHKTRIPAKSDWRYGWVAGVPLRYIHGHQARKIDNYVIKDRGYTTPCWVWQGTRNVKGYAKIRFDGKSISVHRFMYERYIAPIPDGLQIDHRCYIKACVNPTHLEVVTNALNCQRRPNGKLTKEQIPILLEMCEHMTQREVGRRFGVSQSMVSLIVRGKEWTC